MSGLREVQHRPTPQGALRLCQTERPVNDSQASLMLDEAAIKCDTRIWPYAVIRYLRGDLSEGALLTFAGTDDQRAEAHTYIGMDVLLKGQREEARTHFLWMRQNGSPRLLEYPLAVAELGRLERLLPSLGTTAASCVVKTA